MKLSVVIPSYKDPYLFKTIRSLLDNSELGDQLEIIPVFDGYWPAKELMIQDPRVRYVHLGKNRGMRGAINAGVAVARGEFFMRLDEHCTFAKGYDKALTDACQPNQIMTARRYFLDPVKWEVMQDKGYIDYEDLSIQRVSDTVRKFAGKPNKEKAEQRKDIMIDETQAMQGSMWIAHRETFLKWIGELQTEGYGPLIQDSVEVCMKYWKNGGKLMVNKNTWFAHKHRDFPRTHNNGSPENPAKNDAGYTYALEQWEDYYQKELLPLWSSST
jgi:glycosyltransferase involved in cell wall biosynthesis